jgi:hypothetical protein
MGKFKGRNQFELEWENWRAGRNVNLRGEVPI